MVLFIAVCVRCGWLLFVVVGVSLVCVMSLVVCCSCCLIDVVLLTCGGVRCLLCVVVAVLLFVVNGSVGVYCSLSDCRCVRFVGMCRLLLDLGVCGVVVAV